MLTFANLRIAFVSSSSVQCGQAIPTSSSVQCVASVSRGETRHGPVISFIVQISNKAAPGPGTLQAAPPWPLQHCRTPRLSRPQTGTETRPCHLSAGPAILLMLFDMIIIHNWLIRVIRIYNNTFRLHYSVSAFPTGAINKNVLMDV